VVVRAQPHYLKPNRQMIYWSDATTICHSVLCSPSQSFRQKQELSYEQVLNDRELWQVRNGKLYGLCSCPRTEYVLGNGAAQTCRQMTKFQRNVLSPSSGRQYPEEHQPYPQYYLDSLNQGGLRLYYLPLTNPVTQNFDCSIWWKQKQRETWIGGGGGNSNMGPCDFNWLRIWINVFYWTSNEASVLEQQLLTMFFWVKSPCDLVGKSQHFGEACCLHLQGWRSRPKEHHQNCHRRENLKSHNRQLIKHLNNYRLLIN
jgi:hypothetical protein